MKSVVSLSSPGGGTSRTSGNVKTGANDATNRRREARPHDVIAAELPASGRRREEAAGPRTRVMAGDDCRQFGVGPPGGTYVPFDRRPKRIYVTLTD